MLVFAGFVSAFVGGYFLKTYEFNNYSPSIDTPIENDDKNGELGVNELLFLPDKLYFLDTVVVVSETNPRYVLALTATRGEQEDGYLQQSRLSFFDGETWTRDSLSEKTQNSAIKNNTIISRWETTIDPSRVLREQSSGEVVINDTKIAFSTGMLENEMGIRSLPYYTKFSSEGDAELSIDGVTHPARVFYTRIFSINAADVLTYDKDLHLETFWLIFWDENGNFYHIDVTDVENPIPRYTSHSLALKKQGQIVEKSFDIKVEKDANTPPSILRFSVDTPESYVLRIERLNEFDKYPYLIGESWIMGTVQGSSKVAESVESAGHGVMEYISR